jgi:hypothetical protein
VMLSDDTVIQLLYYNMQVSKQDNPYQKCCCVDINGLWRRTHMSDLDLCYRRLIEQKIYLSTSNNGPFIMVLVKPNTCLKALLEL